MTYEDPTSPLKSSATSSVAPRTSLVVTTFGTVSCPDALWAAG